jgi:ribosome-associated toxin RatA of RatAB toxin-antitoxin module
MECSVVVHALVPGGNADEAFDRAADFERYPVLTRSVRTVSLRDLGSASLESTWEVNFRKGVLVWTEQDTIDPANRRIEFRQTKGDFASFAGSWVVTESGDDVLVAFASRFDLGIASLAALVDPIACAALRDGIHDILLGLFGEDIEIRDIEAAPLVPAP